jgi:peptidoglycan hydrolase-like protein with peptidoglycan-binding domain
LASRNLVRLLTRQFGGCRTAGHTNYKRDATALASAGKARINPVLIKAQVLLDRAHFSPGEIDGKFGENFKKALRGFAAAQGLRSTGELTNEIWQKLTSTSAEPVLTRYTITNDDMRGPFVDSIPSKLEKMKDLPVLAYTSPGEKIAEKFHMSREHV